MPRETVAIKDLIISAAEGASDGVEVLQDADIAVVLEEFEMEVTYAAETSITNKTEGTLGGGLELKFVAAKAEIGHTRSSRTKASYGLKVRFLFSGKEKEENAS